MRNLIINSSMNFIKNNCNYEQSKLEEIKYGLESIYILITKTIIILSVAFLYFKYPNPSIIEKIINNIIKIQNKIFNNNFFK